MSGRASRTQEKIFEVLAYRADGTFFSWYRVDANDLLSATRQKQSATWEPSLSGCLERNPQLPSFFDMPYLLDEHVSVELLAYTPRLAQVDLHRDGELVALCSLDLAVDTSSGRRFSRRVTESVPAWETDALEEDLLSNNSQAVIFLAQAPCAAAEAHWATLYECAILMMAVYCRDAGR